MSENTNSNRRVLVIDDEKTIHDVFRRILGKEVEASALDDPRAGLFSAENESKAQIRYEIDAAFQGEEGLDKVRQAVASGQPYALAFVDMHMPMGWDGLETVEQLWKVDSNLQVVICTGYADPSWKDVVDRLGVNDRLLLLKKPFDVAEAWQLACALSEKWNLAQQAQLKLNKLEAMVEERTYELKREIADRVQAEEMATRLGRIVEDSLNEIYIFDCESLHFIHANRGAQENLGYSMDELRKITPMEIQDEANVINFSKMIETVRLGANKKAQYLTTHRRKDGSTYPVEMHLQILSYHSKPVFLAFALDITRRQEAYDRLQYQALHDPLTDLPNRALLLERLNVCVQRVRRQPDYQFAVLFLDLDNFKVVNDQLGHEFGDELLVQVADRLQQCLRSLDAITRLTEDSAMRLGGDEFIVLLDGISHVTDTAVVADRILEYLAQPFLIGTNEVRITASIGIAPGDDRYSDAAEILRDADKAMYRAKGSGKAQYALFDRVMHESAVTRLRMENEVRSSFERGELYLLYQPIVLLPTKQLVGLEALLCWDNPNRPDIPPARFINTVEESGLVVPIGRWVLEEACRQTHKWNVEFERDLFINVNLTLPQLLKPSFLTDVESILNDTHLQRHQLNFEITEGGNILNTQVVTERLEQLKDLGVGLHLDDFGTGPSSMCFLHRSLLDVVKIDRAFTSGVFSNLDSTAIITAIVALSHAMKMKVTVEGVETAEQLAKLVDLGCDFAQGVHFSKPVKAAEARRLFETEPWSH